VRRCEADDLVRRLVLAAQARQQLVQLRGIVDGRGGGLPHARRGSFDRYPGEFGGLWSPTIVPNSLVFSRIDRGHGFTGELLPRAVAAGQSPCGTGAIAASLFKMIQDRR
jgi:hypothetical protein